jgi:ABC-type multidrug transport system fused ATPase/permease subunit
VLSYSGQALIGILVNKLIEATTLKTITFASILGLFIALLVSLILPRILNVYRSFRELEDWRKMELFYEQTLSSKFASMDFALHDNPKVVDLSRKVRDNIFRV